MQLRPALVALLALAGVAHADGELTVRGAYYKEKATRVTQPMIDVRLDVGEHGTVDGHMLADAITSASVGAFQETRIEAGGGYSHIFMDETLTLGADFRYSSEPDYKSTFGVVRGAKELADRNFTIGGALAGGLDKMSGIVGMNVRTGELKTGLASINASQILSPNLVVGVTFDLIAMRGEQANLYRSVIANGMELPEEAPDYRRRQAIAGSVKYWLIPTSTTLIGTYRYYFDTWDIAAHTPELRAIQDVDDVAWFTARYRYHTQRKAFFFEDRYPDGVIPELPSDDQKLSKFQSHTMGAQLEVAGEAFGFTDRLGATRAQIVIEYIVQSTAFGNAVVAHAALTVPIEY